MPDWTRDLLLATSTDTAGTLAGCAGLVSETTETTTQGEPSTTSATTENEFRDSTGYLRDPWHGESFVDVDYFREGDANVYSTTAPDDEHCP